MNNPKFKKIYGWSRSDSSISRYFNISSTEKLYDLYETAKKDGNKISFRGSGRSYGDNTLNDNNIIINYRSKKQILSFNNNTGLIEVSGSCSLIELISYSIFKGWILNVSPASQFITISGCISNNVHGKNCYQKGYFGDYVEEIKIATPDKGIIICSEKHNSKYFFTAISGLGFIGLIISAKIKLKKIICSDLETRIINVKSLNETVNTLDDLSKNADYNIGSLDLTRFNGNISGKIYTSKFLDNQNLSLSNTTPTRIIKIINYFLLFNNLPVFNRVIEFMFSMITKSTKSGVKVINQNYFEMNFLGDLNLPYYNYFFPKGFIEYQIIFDTNNYILAIEEIEILKKEFGYSSYMSSIKSYRSNDKEFALGLKLNGYCITLDIPYEKSNKFHSFIRKLNTISLKYNGQLYLGKTPCLNRDEFMAMYKDYKKLEKIKLEVDSELIIHSNMTKRLFPNL